MYKAKNEAQNWIKDLRKDWKITAEETGATYKETFYLKMPVVTYHYNNKKIELYFRYNWWNRPYLSRSVLTARLNNYEKFQFCLTPCSFLKLEHVVFQSKFPINFSDRLKRVLSRLFVSTRQIRYFLFRYNDLERIKIDHDGFDSEYLLLGNSFKKTVELFKFEALSDFIIKQKQLSVFVLGLDSDGLIRLEMRGVLSGQNYKEWLQYFKNIIVHIEQKSFRLG